MYAKIDILIEVTTVDGKRIKFEAANEIRVKRSIDSVESSAEIRIPTTAALYTSEKLTGSQQTAKTFKRGDHVTITAGYNGELKQEFDGYIYRVNLTTPTVLELVGWEYQLLGDLKPRTFAATTLREVLSYIIAGTDISLDANIPTVEMLNYVIPADLRAIDALKQVKESYGLTIYFEAAKLYAGLDYTPQRGEVKLSLGVNTLRPSDLKYQFEDDVQLKVKAVQINRDNTKLEAEVGDKNGEQRTLYFYNAKSVADLKKLAEVEMLKYKYSGYTGKLPLFLQPYAEPGMVANIIDTRYAERGGKYEIRATELQIGTGGARRIVELGKTLSA